MQASDHASACKKKKVIGSKKQGCPAAVYLREVITFPEYKVPGSYSVWKILESAWILVLKFKAIEIA